MSLLYRVVQPCAKAQMALLGQIQAPGLVPVVVDL